MKLAINKTVILLASIGLLGTTSASFAETSALSGTPAITVELGNLDTISMGTLPLGEDAQAEEQLCVYSNSGTTGAYKVIFTSTEGSFKLTNGSDEIPYFVYYNDQNQLLGSAISYNITLTGQAVGSIVSYPCTTDNAMITIQIAPDDIEAVPAQAYSGTLTMIVSTP